MLTLLSVLSANAAMVPQSVCADVNTDYVDATSLTGDDFVTADGLYNLKYVHLRVKDLQTGSIVFNGATDANGCTTLSLETTHQHNITVQSRATFPNGGPAVRVVAWRGATSTYWASNVNFWPKTKVGQVTTAIVDAGIPGNRWANVLHSASHAIARRPTAWPTSKGAAHYLAWENTNAGTALAYYDSGGQVLDEPYVLVPHGDIAEQRKYIIVHELGHLLEYRLNCHDNPVATDCRGIVLHASNADYSGSEWQCDGTGPASGSVGTHSYNTREYQSAAHTEGWAHYVSAFAFNRPNESDCMVVPNNFVSWNLLGDTAFDTTNEAFSCEGYAIGDGDNDSAGAEYHFPTTPVDGRDYMGDWCLNSNESSANYGVEIDWIRYYWDVNQTTGINFGDLTRVVSLLDTENWCEDSTCWYFDRPKIRLRDAMMEADDDPSVNYFDVWLDHDNNGVHR